MLFLQVYELVKSDADDASRVTCRHIRTLHGGATQKLLSRSRLLRLPTEGSTGELVVCAADEAAMAVRRHVSRHRQLYSIV